ncbi:ESX secretion-associated protein EspG [Qaidamihabitans albus]|uniref:ESX secretion-associated protein EspG n=1 Tax=Qaidamihabitans albus TaxID=2795733 RepID=UPI0027DCB1CE|nr:ESX secretion-associated protein EspG [Qaidamihabitans albus]
MTRERVDLPIAALAGAVAREKLGELHLVLQPEPIWLPEEARGEAESAVDEALAEAGLVDGRGRVDVEFLDWLPLLTNASLEYYGWFTADGTTWGVLTAARGVQGLLAVRRADWVTLVPIGRNRLAESLVEQLPELVPGGGTPWSVRVADLEAAGRAGTHDRALPVDVREVVKVVQRPVSGSGELYAAERDERGRCLRLRRPLHYVDTDWGRYLNYTHGTGDDEEIHIAPGSPGAIVAALERLRSDLVSAHSS